MDKKTQEEIFNEVFKASVENAQKARRNGVVINSSNEQYYITPLLQKHGLDTWEKINHEANLILEEKCEYSSKIRAVIDHIHTHVLLTYQSQF